MVFEKRKEIFEKRKGKRRNGREVEISCLMFPLNGVQALVLSSFVLLTVILLSWQSIELNKSNGTLRSVSDNNDMVFTSSKEDCSRVICKCYKDGKVNAGVDNEIIINGTYQPMQNKVDISKRNKAYSLITRPYFTLFGDSLTERSAHKDGFSRMLLDIYGRRADLRLRGVSGYTTRDALDVLDVVFPLPDSSLQYCIHAHDRPQLVQIFFGANDAVLKDREPERHVPIKEYGENLQKIIDRIHNIVELMPLCSVNKIDSSSSFDGDDTISTALPYIILVTPPPLLDQGLRKNHITQQYAEKVLEIATANPSNVKVLDIFTKMGGYNSDTTVRSKYLLGDGLHFNAKGQTFFKDELMDLIRTTFPHFHPSNLPYTEHPFLPSYNI